jgi:cbb3-type cytochrome oxidase subunit 3
MGEVYKEMGQTDSALYYLEKAANYHNVSIHTKAAAYYHLYRLFRENQQWTDYARFQQEYEILRDSIEDHTHSETVRRMQALYDMEQAEKEKNILKLQAAELQGNINLLIIGIVFLIILLAVIIYFLWNKAKARNRERDRIAKLLLQDETVKKFHNATRIITYQEVDQLYEAIDRFYPAFRSRLKTDRKLTPENILTAYMLKARLTEQQISVVVSKNRSTGWMRVKSLAEKIFGTATESKERLIEKTAKYIREL